MRVLVTLVGHSYDPPLKLIYMLPPHLSVVELDPIRVGPVNCLMRPGSHLTLVTKFWAYTGSPIPSNTGDLLPGKHLERMRDIGGLE